MGSANTPKRNQISLANWISIALSVLSLIVAMASLLVSYRVYEHSQTERLLVTVLFPSDQTDVHWTASPSMLNGGTLSVIWDCFLTNIGDRPLSLVRYEVREKYSDGTLARFNLPVRIYDEDGEELKSPISLAPAESRLLGVELPLTTGPRALSILKEDFGSSSEVSWTDVVFSLYLHNLDVFDNELMHYRVPGISSKAFRPKPPASQELLQFSFTTGRGATFEAVAGVYGTLRRGLIGK